MKRSIVFCSLFSAAVCAQAESGFYILGSVGQSRFDHNGGGYQGEIEDTESMVGVDFSSQDRNDTGYKLQLGYQFNDHFAIEGGYVDLGELTYKGGLESLSSDAAFHINGKARARGVNLDAVLILPLKAGWSLFGKLGVVSAQVESRISGDFRYGGVIQSESESDKATKVKANFGLGVSYNFYKNVSVRGEVERFNQLGDSVTGKYNVDLYSVGVSYLF